MNICAYRSLLTSDGLANPLPHEPIDETRFALATISRQLGTTPHIGIHVGNYAECKHCGCLYKE